MHIHLLYRSSSVGDLTAGQVNAILAKSIANNRRDGITGLLVYRDRVFLQLLEGDETFVNRCLARVRQDPRHFGVNVLMKAQSENRMFDKWDMAFLPESRVLKPLSEVNTFIETMKSESAPTRATILRIIQEFVKTDELASAQL